MLIDEVNDEEPGADADHDRDEIGKNKRKGGYEGAGPAISRPEPGYILVYGHKGAPLVPKDCFSRYNRSRYIVITNESEKRVTAIRRDSIPMRFFSSLSSSIKRIIASRSAIPS